MGGNALGVDTVRLKADDYQQLYRDLRSTITEVELIPSYRSKETFGDMDVLYRKGELNPREITSQLQKTFTVTNESFNGDVASFGVLVNVPYSEHNVFQIDFIGVPKETASFAFNYFSYNDLGNLIGRVARRIGLKFGHQGLIYTQRAGDQVLHEHVLTTGFSTALYHLGYDAERFYAGFDTLKEIFDFVMSSPFYDFQKFDLSHRNRKARIRDEKRPNYRAFLKYATKNPIVREIADDHMEYHFVNFPNFRGDYLHYEERHHMHQLYKRLYNGDIVMRVTGLAGKELGQFMQSIKSDIDYDFVLFSEPEEIEARIASLYQSYEK